MAPCLFIGLSVSILRIQRITMKPNRAWIWLAVAICGVTFLLSGTASAEKQGKSEAAERVSSNGEDDINCEIVI